MVNVANNNYNNIILYSKFSNIKLQVTVTDVVYSVESHSLTFFYNACSTKIQKGY